MTIKRHEETFEMIAVVLPPWLEYGQAEAEAEWLHQVSLAVTDKIWGFVFPTLSTDPSRVHLHYNHVKQNPRRKV